MTGNLAHKAITHSPGWKSGGIYADYEYAEIMEWLYQDTGDKKFRQEALDWVQKCQKMKPWSSWAYAIEARLQSDPATRMHAIAMTLYLDPKSERVASLSSRDITAAKQYAKSPSFLNTINWIRNDGAKI